MNDARQCTCHPDDNPPVPCARKFALSDCRSSAMLDEAVRRAIPSELQTLRGLRSTPLALRRHSAFVASDPDYVDAIRTEFSRIVTEEGGR